MAKLKAMAMKQREAEEEKTEYEETLNSNAEEVAPVAQAKESKTGFLAAHGDKIKNMKSKKKPHGILARAAAKFEKEDEASQIIKSGQELALLQMQQDKLLSLSSGEMSDE